MIKLNIHILSSISDDNYALCFTETKTNNLIGIVSYNSQIEKGHISSLLPYSISDGNIYWGSSGKIIILSEFNTEIWVKSTHIGKIYKSEYEKYISWALEWNLANKNYSAFEGGRTIKDFIFDSLDFIVNDSKMSQMCLISPIINTYYIRFDTMENVSMPQFKDMILWYESMLLCIPMTMEHTVSVVNSSGYMYYHEYSDNRHKYWRLSGVNISLKGYKYPFKDQREFPQEKDANLINTKSTPTNILIGQTILNQSPSLDPLIDPIVNPGEGLSGIVIIIIFVTLIIIIIVIIVIITFSYKNPAPARNNIFVR
jgi:hypothetical protein